MSDPSNSTPETIQLQPEADSDMELLPFYAKKHRDYIAHLGPELSQKTSYEGAITEHLRMSGVYWSLTAMHLLLPSEPANATMNTTEIVDWIEMCWDDTTGCFGGNTGQPGHLLYTLSALQILALTNQLPILLESPKRDAIVQFVSNLQQPEGSFAGDRAGEIDTRFTYCAFQSLILLDRLDAIDVDSAVQYIYQCRNLDGGYGSCVGAESHAAQVFCCVGALAMVGRVQDDSTLAWWLSERQVDSGGLNGRPEKQADVCYSWWILSALSILGKTSWINGDKLADYILKCQDEETGGIADRPEDMVDVFHTL